MPWFETARSRVWAGCHRILGAVVFDPADQQEVPANRVRLYVTFEGRASLFHNKTARDFITDTSDDVELRQAVEAPAANSPGWNPASSPWRQPLLPTQAYAYYGPSDTLLR
jgi:hypothetical protein